MAKKDRRKEAGCDKCDTCPENNKLPERIRQLIVGTVIYITAILLNSFTNIPGPAVFILFLAAYFIIGGNIVKTAALNIFRGKIFDENFLMTIATLGAFFIAEYAEAVAVMLFFQVGECFQTYAVGKSRRSIASLMDIRPDYAHLWRDGEYVRVPPEEVGVGERIMIKPGERIPLDGIVVSGFSFLETKALTGESVPREVLKGEEVISGCINLNAVIEVKTKKAYSESTVAKILDLVENAGNRKAVTEKFITRFARIYTPFVVAAAFILAVLPPFIIGGDFNIWLYRALTFLVISCPCALVISIPLGFFGGIGGAGRAGILVKGGNYLEALRNVDTVVLDKTGTLTKGNFNVIRIIPEAHTNTGELLEIAAYAEGFSTHPISEPLRLAYGKEIDKSRITLVQEIAGHGVKAKLDGLTVWVGNEKMMHIAGINLDDKSISHSKRQADGKCGTVINIAYDGRYFGHILIADELKDESIKAARQLKKAGINLVMLTGDSNEVAANVAGQLGIDEFYSELLPDEKVKIIENIISSRPEKSKTAFVGDGINDAPVLARADIGIAMGGLGSDAAIEAADIVIMNDNPEKIMAAINISKRTLRIVKENIVFSLGVKAIVLLLAALGFASMWAAVFADVGVAVLAIINTMRVLRYKTH